MMQNITGGVPVNEPSGNASGAVHGCDLTGASTQGALPLNDQQEFSATRTRSRRVAGEDIVPVSSTSSSLNLLPVSITSSPSSLLGVKGFGNKFTASFIGLKDAVSGKGLQAKKPALSQQAERSGSSGSIIDCYEKELAKAASTGGIFNPREFKEIIAKSTLADLKTAHEAILGHAQMSKERGATVEEYFFLEGAKTLNKGTLQILEEAINAKQRAEELSGSRASSNLMSPSFLSGVSDKGVPEGGDKKKVLRYILAAPFRGLKKSVSGIGLVKEPALSQKAERSGSSESVIKFYKDELAKGSYVGIFLPSKLKEKIANSSLADLETARDAIRDHDYEKEMMEKAVDYVEAEGLLEGAKTVKEGTLQLLEEAIRAKKNEGLEIPGRKKTDDFLWHDWRKD